MLGLLHARSATGPISSLTASRHRYGRGREGGGSASQCSRPQRLRTSHDVPREADAVAPEAKTRKRVLAVDQILEGWTIVKQLGLRVKKGIYHFAIKSQEWCKCGAFPVCVSTVSVVKAACRMCGPFYGCGPFIRVWPVCMHKYIHSISFSRVKIKSNAHA